MAIRRSQAFTCVQYSGSQESRIEDFYKKTVILQFIICCDAIVATCYKTCSRVVRYEDVITAQGIAFIDFAIEICDWFNLFESKEDRNNFTENIKGL